MAEKEEMNRLTINLPKETEEIIRDTSLILGIKNSELIATAVTKYVEAIKKSPAGDKFQQALDGIAAVREIHGEG